MMSKKVIVMHNGRLSVLETCEYCKKIEIQEIELPEMLEDIKESVSVKSQIVSAEIFKYNKEYLEDMYFATVSGEDRLLLLDLIGEKMPLYIDSFKNIYIRDKQGLFKLLYFSKDIGAEFSIRLEKIDFAMVCHVIFEVSRGNDAKQ